jgi:predicted transcriptional regulator of viral defense system
MVESIINKAVVDCIAHVEGDYTITELEKLLYAVISRASREVHNYVSGLPDGEYEF